MAIFSNARRAAMLLLASAGLAQAEGWPVTAAPFRAVIQRTQNAPATATVGSVAVWPGPLDPAKSFVYVTTAAGKAVGSKLLWAAPGEPLQIIFDAASNAEAFHVYVSPNATPPIPAWEPAAGVLLETRAAAAGKLDSWTNVRDLWQASTNVQGRSLLTQVYQGHNPHGPSAGFIARYRGTLHIEKAGEYALATVSGDASFLFVDGKLIAQWPGCHGPWPGRHGQFNGKLRLGAGPHVFEYYHAHCGHEPLAQIAWRPPGRDRFEVVPESVFGTVARFLVASAEPAPSHAGLLYAEWEPREHTTLQGLHLVTMKFTVPGNDPSRTYHWGFDDGRTATGNNLEHLFVRPGPRTVQLTARAADKIVASATFQISVRPRWSQLEEWPGNAAREQKKILQLLDLAALPLADLTYLLRYANAWQDRALLDQIGRACWTRHNEITAANASVFDILARHYLDPHVRNHAQAERACRAALALTGADPLLHERCRLRLADLLIHFRGRPAEAAQLLDEIKTDRLAAHEKRRQQILRADIALALGDLAAARQAYAAIDTNTDLTNAQAAVRRRARLAGAQTHLARGNLDEAERILRDALWDTPAEQLSLETGLALLKLHLARKEFPLALTRCTSLLQVAENDNARAELLYHLIEINFALGQDTPARAALAQLLKDHPYTEPAARAKDRWP